MHFTYLILRSFFSSGFGNFHFMNESFPVCSVTVGSSAVT
jgi:hypothetical protein